MLRVIPPHAQLSKFQPERLFVGHGQPLESGANAAVHEALARARQDLPRLLLNVPKLLRGA